jgi:hypothetical protein
MGLSMDPDSGKNRIIKRMFDAAIKEKLSQLGGLGFGKPRYESPYGKGTAVKRSVAYL